MSYFWFFVGMLTVAMALRHIKHSDEANPVVSGHHGSCSCTCSCADHGPDAPVCVAAVESSCTEAK